MNIDYIITIIGGWSVFLFLCLNVRIAWAMIYWFIEPIIRQRKIQMVEKEIEEMRKRPTERKVPQDLIDHWQKLDKNIYAGRNPDKT